MSTRNKILLTIALAILCSWLFGCAQEPVRPSSGTKGHRIDAAYLQSLYELYNATYFNNKLPKDVMIDTLETNPEFMAGTSKVGSSFLIQFNGYYVTAERTAQLTMQHEMCHVKTWGLELDDHGRAWRGCMLQLDMQGAVRLVLIDGYQGR